MGVKTILEGLPWFLIPKNMVRTLDPAANGLPQFPVQKKKKKKLSVLETGAWESRSIVPSSVRKGSKRVLGFNVLTGLEIVAHSLRKKSTIKSRYTTYTLIFSRRHWLDA